MSTSTSTPASTINIPLFARGTIALLTLWPALRLAVAEQWGGPDSAAKRTWMISEVVDYFESSIPGSSNGKALSAEQLGDIVDEEDLEELLEGMISDEFEADLEDNSIEQVAGDIVRLWKNVVKGEDGMVRELEELVRTMGGSKVRAQRGEEEGEVDEDGNPILGDSGSEDESGDEDVDMDAGEGKKVVEKEKQEPVVDEDGFTLVQKKGKK